MGNGDGVTYTVKELITMLEQSLVNQVTAIDHKLDVVLNKLEEKADRTKVHALEARLSALELVSLRRGGPVDLQVQANDVRLRTLELRDAGAAALSTWQRWFFGVICVGLLSAVATLVWLATS